MRPFAHSAILALLALMSLLAACRSTPKSDLQSAPVTTQAGSATASNLCAQPPELKVCCEALTPSCNDCRDGNRRLQESWNQQCHPKAAIDECGMTPPVISCCGEATEECKSCREQAFDKLMRWKEKCAHIEAIRCDRKPELSLCQADALPSSEACRLRNQRLVDEWNRRCRR